MDRLSAPEILRDDRIVYYQSPTQLNFYQYHRWSADPATMVRESVARRLSQTFAHVRLLPAHESVDYLVRGRLLNCEEVDFDGGVRGRVGLELMLVRAHDNKLLWSERRQAENHAEGAGVPAVVQALDSSTQQVLDGLMPALVAQIEQDVARNK